MSSPLIEKERIVGFTESPVPRPSSLITPKEFVLIKERASEGIKMNVDIEDAFQFFRNEGFDYVFIEGFYKFLKNKHQIKQILCVRNDSEIRELLELHKKPICILGIVSDTYQGKGSSQNIPHLNLRRDKAKLIEIISSLVRKDRLMLLIPCPVLEIAFGIDIDKRSQ